MIDSHNPSLANAPAFLDGQMLIAMPGMEDSRFARTVIYLCAHGTEGAMGFIINQPAKGVHFSQVLAQLNMGDEPSASAFADHAGEIVVMSGGPVERERGFLLHSPDFRIANSTLAIRPDVCLTATLDMLRAVATGHGPRQVLFALGCASWAPGQLDMEIQHNGWLHGPADASLLFDIPVPQRYREALRRIGIDPAMLSNEAGHA